MAVWLVIIIVEPNTGFCREVGKEISLRESEVKRTTASTARPSAM
jgi:hypothetical protein